MADKADISAKLEVDGEKAFRDSLKAVDAELKNLKSEMDLTASAMDDLTDSEEKTAKQGETLEKIIGTQEKKLGLLNEKYQASAGKLEDLGRALENAKNEFGANSEQALKAQNAYNKQLKSAMDLKTQINQTAAEMNKAKKDFNDLGKASGDLGESLAKASESGGKLNSNLSSLIKGGAIAGAAAAAAGAVANLASSFFSLDESTEELRENLAKVEAAFSASGKSSESAEKAYRGFYKILGDSDTAAESAQLLAKLAQSEQDVNKWTKIATGVMGTFGDALPINGLIEASNETAKVGQVTGQLADALNWVGISEDDFNVKLASLSTEQERNKLITETLAQAYEEAAQAYTANNSEIMRARDLQAQLDESMAKLGGTVQVVKNNLLEDFLPAIVEIINGFNDLANGVDGAEDAIINGVTEIIDILIGKLPDFLNFGVDLIYAIIKGIIINIPELAALGPKLVWAILQAIFDLGGDLISGGEEIISDLADGAQRKLTEFVAIGSNIVSGLWGGIKSKSSWLKDQVKNWCQSILDSVKEFFHIGSPSKLFADEVGAMLPAGMAIGIDKGAKKALDSMNSLSASVFNAGKMIEPQVAQSTQNQGLIEGLLNGLSAMQDRAVNMAVQVVLPNGEVLAETVFNDLLNVSKQRGVSLASY